MLNRISYISKHIYLLLIYYIRAWFITAFTKDPIKKRHKQAQNIHRNAKKFRKAFKMTLTVNNLERLKAFDGKPLLLVGNHVSYTDIVVLSALDELIFITSVEMGNNPVLGSITRLGGCLYTDRKNPQSLKDEIHRFGDVIMQGFKVVLFPEGTSTNGDTVLDFRRSLFEIASSSGAPILPLCVRYKRLDGKEIDESNRDSLYWYGDMTFLPHFLGLIGKSIEVEVTFLEPIFDTADKKRSDLSDMTHQQIKECFHQDK